MSEVQWRKVNDEPYEYAIQRGPHGDKFVKLLDGSCLRGEKKPQIYDIGWDAFREATQEDIDFMRDVIEIDAIMRMVRAKVRPYNRQEVLEKLRKLRDETE